MESFTLSNDQVNIRLDKLLALQFPSHSRTYFQYLIENGYVLVNGVPIKKREKPAIGDEIEVCFALTPEISLEPENIPLDILFEDEHLLAINKPVDFVVHPAPGHPNGTFVNALLHHCQNPLPQHPLRPGIVHRLDKDTTGVLIAAKTEQAHAALVALFASREIKKIYHAICFGTPTEGLIDAPIGRHPTRRKEMAICPKGKEAKTIVHLLAKEGPLSYIELDLLTGRTHQIRVHLKHINAPILGDPVYGAPQANAKYHTSRPLLHAKSVQFTHPITQQPITLEAPLPDDFTSRPIVSQHIQE